MSKKQLTKFAPITDIFVSSNVGKNDVLNRLNENAKKSLQQRFRHVTNSNGEMRFGLTDLEEKIVKASDAYVFLPIPQAIKQLKFPERKNFFREMFKAASLHVGVQTEDPFLFMEEGNPKSPLKPIVLINHNDCYEPFRELIDHMHKLGTITHKLDNIHFVNNIGEGIKVLQQAHHEKAVYAPHKTHVHKSIQISLDKDPDLVRKPNFNVCVFCSASTKNPDLIAIAKKIGADIAAEDWGIISGLGATGMMGAVVEGAAEVIKAQGKGWIGGSNLSRIIKMEGLPSYYDKIWLADDIYKRMEVMVENSQAFVIMPGGMGTVQELMALLLLKHADNQRKPNLMHDKKFGNKPIILVNHELKNGQGEFWAPLVKMANQFGFNDDIIVVDSVEEAQMVLKDWHRIQSQKALSRAG